jgi:hypothetical protein
MVRRRYTNALGVALGVGIVHWWALYGHFGPFGHLR